MGEPHLNGAYYGPSIPPPSKSYHRPGRGGGGGCNPFSCCCGCLCSCIFNLICQLIITAVVLIGVAILIFWLVFRPNKVNFHVTDATLTQFDFSTTNNTLYYNLALNMTIRNPNQRIGIYYDKIEANTFYGGQRFATNALTPFYQGHKNTKELGPVEFQGQNLVLLEDKEVSDYNSDKSSGTYSIDLKLYLRIRFKFGIFKSPKFKPKINCGLKVPLGSSGTFQTTKCGLNW